MLALWKVGVHSQHAHTTPTPNSLAAKNAFGRWQLYEDLNSRLSSQQQWTLSVSPPELYLLSPDYASWSFSSLIFFSSLVYVLLVSWIMIRFTMRPFLFFFFSSLLCFFVMFILPFNLSVIFVWAWPLEDNDGNNEGSLAETNMASQVPWRLYSYVYWVLHAHSFLLSLSHWLESEKSILALHVLPSLSSHRLARKLKLCSFYVFRSEQVILAVRYHAIRHFALSCRWTNVAQFFFFLLFQISPGTILLPFSELLSETSCIFRFGVDELQLFCDIQNFRSRIVVLNGRSSKYQFE